MTKTMTETMTDPMTETMTGAMTKTKTKTKTKASFVFLLCIVFLLYSNFFISFVFVLYSILPVGIADIGGDGQRANLVVCQLCNANRPNCRRQTSVNERTIGQTTSR